MLDPVAAFQNGMAWNSDLMNAAAAAALEFVEKSVFHYTRF
jgi:Na+(H+)/acetate symporter ActP